MIQDSLLNAIGDTPLVPLKKINPNKNVTIYAKLEGQNPGGSIKDRAAKYMIGSAEKRGDLTEGKTILEATSGNMGIALAMVGAHKGYSVKIVMSEGMSDERKRMIRALGAELILTDKNLGTEGAIRAARKLVEESPDQYWFVDQFNNKDNMIAHRDGLAVELLEELPQIDVLIAGSGTGGTIMGLAQHFRNASPQTKIIGITPEKGYGIQGIQNPEEDFRGGLLQDTWIDERLSVTNDEAYAHARRLAKEEGLFAGMSSGAALAIALEKAAQMKSGNIVVIFADRGEKYLSTSLYA